jgi:hypothetical protein
MIIDVQSAKITNFAYGDKKTWAFFSNYPLITSGAKKSGQM